MAKEREGEGEGEDGERGRTKLDGNTPFFPPLSFSPTHQPSSHFEKTMTVSPFSIVSSSWERAS